jgi:hypothetical protein
MHANSVQQTLLVATRKGLFVLEHLNGEWSISAHHFVGEPVSQTLVDPRTNSWYAALKLGHFGAKLHRSDDQGKTWRELNCPALPPKPTEGYWADDPSIWSIEMIWSLAAGSASQPGRLWAGCMPAALFRSDDHGNSWQLCESLWMDERRKQWVGGGNDYPGMHSVVVDPRDANHVTVAVSCGGIWTSHDSGQSFELIGNGFNATFMPPEFAREPNAQDPHRLSMCSAHPDVMWVQLHDGMYRSIDSGRHFTQISAHPKLGQFGFAVVAHPSDPLSAWFVPAVSDAHRFAPNASLVVTRTRDGGQSYETLQSGLPTSHCYDLIYRHCAVLAKNERTFAIASTTGNLWISPDAGEHWQAISTHLPPIAALEFF